MQRAARGVQVAGLMGVVMCMYSGVGTQLFVFVKHGEPGGITRQVNFSSFGNSFLILFQCMTSDLPHRPAPTALSVCSLGIAAARYHGNRHAGLRVTLGFLREGNGLNLPDAL